MISKLIKKYFRIPLKLERKSWKKEHKEKLEKIKLHSKMVHLTPNILAITLNVNVNA